MNMTSETPVKKTFRTLLATLILLCLAAATAGTALAATLTVTTNFDSAAGSLRTAIANALAGDTIVFATNLSGQTITLTSGQLLVGSNLTIDASALSNRVVISANNASRVLMVTNNATVVLKSLGIYYGQVSNDFGAGIYNNTSCTLTLSNCQVQLNSVASAGLTNVFGGGLYNAGTLTLARCNVSSNSVTAGPRANAGGGGLYNAGSATLAECNLGNNSAVAGDGVGFGPGGAGAGGGIYNGGTLTLSRNTIQFNDAIGGAGMPSTMVGADGGPGLGGGLCNAGSATLNQNSFGQNTAGGGDGGSGGSRNGNGASSYGGGIYNTNLLILNQNTISANSVITGIGAGPAGLFGSGTNGLAQGGGVFTAATGTNCSPLNCLVARNLAPNLAGSATNSDVFGIFSSRGHNLVGATNASTGFGTNTDLKGTSASPLNPQLNALIDHGGPTFTFSLQPASPAVDAGDDSVTNSFATDQRGTGFPRRSGSHVDIGSYEVQAGNLPIIGTLGTSGVTLDPVTQLGSFNLSATVNPNSYEAPATVWAQYGPYATYGQTTTQQGLSAGVTDVPVNASLTGLAPGLAWHYRWVAANYYGTNFSADQSVNVGPQLYAQGFTDGQNNVINSPNTFNLYTLTQYTNNGATNFTAGRNTGRADVTNSPNTYNLFTLTQYTNNGATNFAAGRNTGRADVTNSPNTYGLFTLSQYNTNGVTNFNAGVATVTNSPNSYNLFTLTQYTNNGATNFSAGRNTGRSDVTNSPNTYGLFTLSQYNTNGATNFTAGVATVTNSPNSYNLYTSTQYTTNGATNFIVGRNTGRADVTNSPNTYGLFTLSQYNTNGAINFTAGVATVTNAPNSYSLYTLTQYNTNFTFGRNIGRSDVTNSPNTYGLYTVSQLQALDVSAPLLAKNPTNGMFKLTIGVQRAPHLTNFVAFPMNGAGFNTSINSTGQLEFNFTDTNNAAFFRLLSQ